MKKYTKANSKKAKTERLSLKNISADRRNLLNLGQTETQNLVEGLSVDFDMLLQTILPKADRCHISPDLGILKRMQQAAILLNEHLGFQEYATLCQHPSDTIRGWAAYLLALQDQFSLPLKLEQIMPLADDSHFGVREWAWLALRPHIAKELPLALELLTPWTISNSERLRRFATEITRPRGVWCSHIAALKEKPALGQSLLEPLKSDPSRYVQDSVANWLNDASKTQPKWVTDFCQRWKKESQTPETQRICIRAMRTMTKL